MPLVAALILLVPLIALTIAVVDTLRANARTGVPRRRADLPRVRRLTDLPSGDAARSGPAGHVHDRSRRPLLAVRGPGFRRRVRGRDRRARHGHRPAHDIPRRRLARQRRGRRVADRRRERSMARSHGSDDLDGVRRQAARSLSLDHDGRGWAEVGTARSRSSARSRRSTTGSVRSASTRPTRRRPRSSSASASRCARHASSRSASCRGYGDAVEIGGQVVRPFPRPQRLLEVPIGDGSSAGQGRPAPRPRAGRARRRPRHGAAAGAARGRGARPSSGRSPASGRGPRQGS